MTIKKIVHLCSTLALALSATTSQAANYAGNTFEIEMIVFERPQGMAQTNETWPAEPSLTYPARWVDFETPAPREEKAESPVATAFPESTELPQEDTALDEEPVSFAVSEFGDHNIDQAPPLRLLLSPVDTKLDTKAAALVRGGDRILFHKAWHQVLEQKHKSPAILIDGGETFSGHSQLEGSVTLSVSRYLHLSTNLWLNDFSAPASAEGIRLPHRPKAAPTPSEETISFSATNEGLIASNPNRHNFSNAAGDQEPITLDAPAEQPVYVMRAAHLQHERRMRSGQLHYIDHPAFGILIEIRTVAENNEEVTEETTPVTL
ncbi:CsiV family protein [Microbulbifer sp. VAAC004]|uniref:CsiV family protein n=1 Tax=unclassified Microbulbifer TaxID=2619833 RepID=UPI00403A40C2